MRLGLVLGYWFLQRHCVGYTLIWRWIALYICIFIKLTLVGSIAYDLLIVMHTVNTFSNLHITIHTVLAGFPSGLIDRVSPLVLKSSQQESKSTVDN